ncbi:hypothetical protein [Dickeya solani]|uniref:Uncharacterized protein n=2 Tax=Dickeya solani TaxID=1089444 RepID=A0AAP1XHS7_9GAMM|nr:hypothetical protein [Dickeya solani]ANE77329.1 hypothetical protein A4U42_19450 [Dickeya solani IPO 2222]AUC40606.1 hypothetical protein D083_0256 [Dickeya solani RNS 08.23.3.1.A]AUH07262.1 hypothetical protein BJD21_01595 [Dickeya solani D s0432-1]AUH11307.1 hypothetical protein BJJ98_01555 [Dickeya solani]AYQ47918.1 hypothetical protein CTB91_02116 [Dickeya solani]
MKIDSEEYNLLVNQRSQANNATRRKEDTSPFAALLAANISASSPTSQSTTAPSTQAETYDFTRMTPTTLHESVNRLVRSGQLDLDQTTPLVGMMGSTDLSNAGVMGTTSLAYSEQPMNVFNQLQENMAVALSRNDSQSADGLQRTIDALRRLQGQTVTSDVRA